MIEKTYYMIQLPLVGRPGEWYTLVRCETPVCAGRVVEVLLSCGDKALREIRVELFAEFNPE